MRRRRLDCLLYFNKLDAGRGDGPSVSLALSRLERLAMRRGTKKKGILYLSRNEGSAEADWQAERERERKRREPR